MTSLACPDSSSPDAAEWRVYEALALFESSLLRLQDRRILTISIDPGTFMQFDETDLAAFAAFQHSVADLQAALNSLASRPKTARRTYAG